MNNLEIYNKARKVPQEAIKDIIGGRLKGMSNINPQWRLEQLTALFGACGVGWYYEISEKWTDIVNKEIIANVCIKLYVKENNEWSKAIIGIGANKLVIEDKNGLYNNDEAWKMATTDALSVACKQLGIGADVYFKYDKTKYDDLREDKQETKEQPKEQPKAETKPNETIPGDKWEEVDRILKLDKKKDGTPISKYFKLMKISEIVGERPEEIINDFDKHFGYKQVNNAPDVEFIEFIKEWYINKFTPKEQPQEEVKYKDIDFGDIPVEFVDNSDELF